MVGANPVANLEVLCGTGAQKLLTDVREMVRKQKVERSIMENQQHNWRGLCICGDRRA